MSDEEISDEEFWLIPEDNVYFTGECTCEHEEGQHSWGSCGVETGGEGRTCACMAGWEE